MLLALALIALTLLSHNAGISGDEVVHFKHAEYVLDYFASNGESRLAIDTPVTNLKHYGQSVDNLTTLISRIFNIEDAYQFRHLFNSLLAWLCILFTALVAIRLSGYKAAIFAVVILLASPRFIGHSLNNLKDIPFALGYIASLYFTLSTIGKSVNYKPWNIIGLILSMAFTLSVRPGGLIVFCYYLLFTGIWLYWKYYKGQLQKSKLIQTILNTALVCLSAYLIGLLFWPYALENILVNPLKSLKMMSNYPVILRQLFEGTMYWSDDLPWYYLLKYIAITIPIVVLPLSFAHFIHHTVLAAKALKNKQETKENTWFNAIVIFAVIFPLLYTILAKSNVYGGWRHLLFIYPPLVIMAAVAFSTLVDKVKKRVFRILAVCVFILTLFPSGYYTLKYHPLEYTYFNSLAGNYKDVANKYEIDYYYHSVGQAYAWLNNYLDCNIEKGVKIASNYGADHYINKKSTASFKYIPYYARGNDDWDYGVFFRASILPSQTKDKLWPPAGTIHTIKVEDIPVCVIVKRENYDDYNGKIAFENGQYKEAIELLKQAVNHNPGNEIAWINLGKSYIKLNNYKAAQETFMQCLDIIPDYEPCLFYLADIEYYYKNFDEARNHYKTILKNNPKSFNAYIAYAELELEKKNYAKALSLVQECLNINSQHKDALDLKEKIDQLLK